MRGDYLINMEIEKETAMETSKTKIFGLVAIGSYPLKYGAWVSEVGQIMCKDVFTSRTEAEDYIATFEKIAMLPAATAALSFDYIKKILVVEFELNPAESAGI